MLSSKMRESALSVSQLEQFQANSQILAIQPQLNSLQGPALRLDPNFIKPTYSTCTPIRLLHGTQQTIMISFLAHCGDRFVVRLQSQNITASCSPILTRMEDEVYCCTLKVSPYSVGTAMSQLEICYSGFPVVYVVLYFKVEPISEIALSGQQYHEQRMKTGSQDASAWDQYSGRMSVGLDRRSQYVAYCTQTCSEFSPAIMQTSEIKRTGIPTDRIPEKSNAFMSSVQENDFLPPSLVYNSMYTKNQRVPRIRTGVLGKTQETQTYGPAVSSAIERSVMKYDFKADASEQQLKTFPGDTILNPEPPQQQKSQFSQGSVQYISQSHSQKVSFAHSQHGSQVALSSNGFSGLKRRSAVFSGANAQLVRPRERSDADGSSVSELSQEFVFQPVQTIPNQVIFAPADEHIPEIAKLRIKNFIGSDICCAISVQPIDIVKLGVGATIAASLVSDAEHFALDQQQLKIEQNGASDLTITFKPTVRNKISVGMLHVTHLDTEILVPLIGCCGCAHCEFQTVDGQTIARNSGECDVSLRFSQSDEPCEQLLRVGETAQLGSCISARYNCYLLNHLLSTEFADLFRALKASDWEDQARRVASLCEESWEYIS